MIFFAKKQTKPIVYYAENKTIKQIAIVIDLQKRYDVVICDDLEKGEL